MLLLQLARQRLKKITFGQCAHTLADTFTACVRILSNASCGVECLRELQSRPRKGSTQREQGEKKGDGIPTVFTFDSLTCVSRIDTFGQTNATHRRSPCRWSTKLQKKKCKNSNSHDVAVLLLECCCCDAVAVADSCGLLLPRAEGAD